MRPEGEPAPGAPKQPPAPNDFQPRALAAPAVLLCGVIALVFAARRRKPASANAAEAALSDDETRRLAALAKSGDKA